MTVYNGTSGNDTFVITSPSQLAAGDVFNGDGGTDIITLDINTILSADFSQITLNGISAIEPGGTVTTSVPTILTVAELNSLSTVTVQIDLFDGGVVSLAGKTIGSVIQLANANTTLDLSAAICSNPYLQPNQFGFIVYCGAATNTITTSNTVETQVLGSTGNDTVYAGSAGAQIAGGGGQDKLYGGAGNDEVSIGGAADELAGSVFDGGGGNNTLVLDGATDLSLDTVANFQTIQSLVPAQTTIAMSQLAGVTDLQGSFNFVGSGTADFSSITYLDLQGTTSFGSDITTVDFSHAHSQGGGAPTFYLNTNGVTFIAGSFAYVLYNYATGVTITSGSGGGNVNLGTGGGTFNAGSGNDIVHVGGGLVNITGGSGNLTVYLNALPASGSTFTGGTGTSLLDIGSPGVDLSTDTVSGFTSLDAEYVTTMSAGLLAGFSEIAGSLTIKGTGAISLAGKTLDDFTITLDPAGGSVDFTGAIVDGGPNSASAGATINGGNGANVIVATNGDDVINTAGQGDTIQAGGGDDTIDINLTSGIVTGSYDGGAGANTLIVSGGDLTHATFANIQTPLIFGSGYGVSSVALTIAQLESFTTEVSGGVIGLVDGGTITMAGVKGEDAQFQLSDTATTLDLRGFEQFSVIATGGAGDDTIYGLATGTASASGYVDQLYGGGGNDTLIGSSGNDYLDGGTGINTAAYDGVQQRYRITEAADTSFVLADTGTALNDGTDHLVDIQHLRFADGLIDLTAATLEWIGDGNTFQLFAGQTLDLESATTTGDMVNGDNGTIDLDGANLIATGNDQTINTSDEGGRVSTSGANNTIVARAKALVTVGGNGQAAPVADFVTFTQPGSTNDNSSVIETDNSRIDVTGTAFFATLGHADTIAVHGGGEMISAPDSGDAVAMTDTAGNWDTLAGSGENLTLNGAQAAITGGGNTIGFAGTGDVVGLYGTAGSWDSVTASGGDTIYLTGAQAAIAGGGTTISFAGGTGNVAGLYDTGGAWDSVWAPGGETIYLTSAQAAITGGGNTVSFAGGTGNVVGLYDTGGTWDSVWAPGGETIYLTSAQAAVAGGGNTVSFAGGTGNVAGLYNTGGSWDSVWAPGGETIYLTSAQAAITGGGDAISFAGGTGNIVGLYNTGGMADTVWAPGGGTIDLTNAQVTVTGGGDTIGFAAGTGNAATVQGTNGMWDAEWGSNGTLNLISAQAAINGSSNTVSFAGSSMATLAGTSELLTFAQGIGGQDVINGFGASDTLQLSASDFDNWAHLLSSGDIAQVGADTVITLDANDSIRLTSFTASKLTSAQVHFV